MDTFKIKHVSMYVYSCSGAEPLMKLVLLVHPGGPGPRDGAGLSGAADFSG